MFLFSSRRRHTSSVSAFLLNRSSDLRHENIQLGGCQSSRLFPRQIRANTISFTVFPEIVPSIGNSFINTMKNINHTRSSISDVATDNNTVGMGDAGIKSAIQGSNVPNPDEAVPSFVSGAMAKAGKGLLEGTLQAGTSAVSDKLLDLVGLGGKSAAD